MLLSLFVLISNNLQFSGKSLNFCHMTDGHSRTFKHIIQCKLFIFLYISGCDVVYNKINQRNEIQFKQTLFAPLQPFLGIQSNVIKETRTKNLS